MNESLRKCHPRVLAGIAEGFNPSPRDVRKPLAECHPGVLKAIADGIRPKPKQAELNLLPRGRIKAFPNGLGLDFTHATDADITTILQRLLETERVQLFYWGDLLLHLETRGNDSANFDKQARDRAKALEQAVKKSRYCHETLFSAKRVCRAIPPECRRPELSFCHHQTVLVELQRVGSDSPETINAALEMVAGEQLTYSQTRRKLREAHRAAGVEDSAPIVSLKSVCARYFLAVNALGDPKTIDLHTAQRICDDMRPVLMHLKTLLTRLEDKG